MQILRALALQSSNQLLRNSEKAETSDHDGCTVEDVAESLFRISNNFVHSVSILSELAGGTHCHDTPLCGFVTII